MNKKYGSSRQFYTQAKNSATIEHRPRIERLVEEKQSTENLLITTGAVTADNLSLSKQTDGTTP